ncbi:hypothetical protein J437_LFUL010187 [Ladona fulva]|uniref:Uncharacterized protein n=1 Tax=Ladona fulva TaxID=123851 RepID=A0A8K0P451_LADFU|nr:hypothetical protein J437_LFUL010187 [Ladona fulva]
MWIACHPSSTPVMDIYFVSEGNNNWSSNSSFPLEYFMAFKVIISQTPSQFAKRHPHCLTGRR